MSERPDGGFAVWDLPVRLIHWLLAALIAFSWWSAEYHHLDWHIWSGIAVLTLLLFRLLWGLFGSSTARFANFVRGPRAVMSYLRNARDWDAAGHSPLGALSVVALLTATAVQVALGLVATDHDGFNQGPLAGLVSVGASDSAREIHETMFYVLLALIALHVAAIVYYRLMRGKKLLTAMITGRSDAAGQAMRPGKWWVALLCLIAAFAISRWVVAGAPPFGG